jgi:ATP-binding cassette, subfamily B, bacterial
LPTVSQAVGAKFLQPLSKTLHWESVTYRPPGGRLLLDRLDLQVRAGRTYSVVSLDEREARAFAFLLPRFIEPQSGRVLFDGEDIAWGTLESLRAEVVLATADDPLLSGTVLDNIRAGRSEITLNQATEAAKEARAHNFIARLPQGYETELSLRDAALDAGQRFRLSLARALVRKPAVLIIEEPAEELDDDTKQLIDDTYGRICPGRTVFFLPRRLSAVRSSDDVIVLRQGRVEAFGPHAVLVKESPLYRHWEYVHFHEFRRDGQA